MLSVTKLFSASTQKVILNGTWESHQLHAVSGVTVQTANIAPSCTTVRFVYGHLSDFVLVLRTSSNSIAHTVQFPGLQYPRNLSYLLEV